VRRSVKGPLRTGSVAWVGSRPVTLTPDESAHPARPPAPLIVAVSLAAVEAVVFGILAVAELFALQSDKALMGTTTALFFLIYGAALAFCAWSLRRLRSWARAPIVLAQLLQLLVAWGFRGGETTWVAVALAVVAAVVLVGVFHPQSLEALAEDR
jgi:peptidoglycan/LPS O-acetylase OafA/YrhL